MNRIFRPTPSANNAQHELAKALSCFPRVPHGQSGHPIQDILTHEGSLQLCPDGTDPWHLFAIPPEFSTSNFRCIQVLVRQRCNNITIFNEPVDLCQIFASLRKMQRCPVEPLFRFELKMILGMERWGAVESSRTIFEALDRMTSMGRAEGGETLLDLGLVAGAITLCYVD